MEEIESLVITAADTNVALAERLWAFGKIVLLFQDMAYGCAYALLGDFHLAEDAAQEAFLAAYRQLGQLRQPGAFPGWFRRIVISQCSRLVRRKSLSTTTLDAAAAVPSSVPAPPQNLERHETKDKVLAAIAALPEHQRMVTTLFYIGGHAQSEIGAFLEIPAKTVKSRLHTARTRLRQSGSLRERMIDMVEEQLHDRRPSRDESFTVRVIDDLTLLTDQEIQRLLPTRSKDHLPLLSHPPQGASQPLEYIWFVVYKKYPFLVAHSASSVPPGFIGSRI